jgi:uncharacterized protein (DUF2252 family)
MLVGAMSSGHPLGTVTERYARGAALRKKTPREKHADLRGPADRDAVAILSATNRMRIPELVPIRYQRMLASPFAFLRGAAAVMAADLAHQPVAGIPVQACGDCHLMNFGAFATPEDHIIFDINDFDETLPGVDFSVDLKRLAASVAVAAVAAGHSKKQARAMAAASVGAYRSKMHRLAALSPIEVWHERIELVKEIETMRDRALRRRLQALVTGMAGRLERDDNFPHLVKGKRAKIQDRPPFIYHFDKADAWHRIDPERVFSGYEEWLAPERLSLLKRYQLKDIAFKVVGVGSVGTFCAVGLFMSGDDAPLFLQIKEARRSVLERLAPHFKKHPGQRVVHGQRMMQAASDLFLGWTQDRKTERHFYVRQLKNRRLGSVAEIVEQRALIDYARLCGRTLARAHARSAEPAMIAGYMGKSQAMDDALASFAMAYAKRTDRDYDRLMQVKGKLGKTDGKP